MSVTTVNERLKGLTEAGRCVWLDQIRRSRVTGGKLARMVAEESLRGVTANPSIFEKAILGSNDYDDELVAMAREQLDSQTIYERIAVKDVQLAADVLADVHRRTHFHDGFVSLEVAPDIASDAERTTVMIKIPGTPEGAIAIEKAIYEGINVNVTLLFAVSAYERVAEAYLRGARAASRTGGVRRGDRPRHAAGATGQRQRIPTLLPQPAGHRRPVLGAVAVRPGAGRGDG